MPVFSTKAKEIIDLPDERLEAITYYLRNLKTYSANKNIKEYIVTGKQIGRAHV